MRLLALLPDLFRDGLLRKATEFLARHPRLANLPPVHKVVVHPRLYTHVAWGGALNIMRHAKLASTLGVETLLATPTGRDTYGEFSVVDLPRTAWRKRRDDDIVLIPDFCSALADECTGPVIVYLQTPIHLRRDFDFHSARVSLWTNSPYMLEKCQEVFPGKNIPIVPNMVDDRTFPFAPQDEREPGLAVAFPRKGSEFIEATIAHYRALGGRYWRFELIDGVPLKELARRMRRPQAFLASADVEGCALPPQECMASGIVVVGKNARGANFSMQHRKTAMVADTPQHAAECLREIEDASLRDTLSRNAHAFISRYFPSGEPTDFWRQTLSRLGVPPHH